MKKLYSLNLPNPRVFATLLFIVLGMMTQQVSARNAGNNNSTSHNITYTITVSPILYATISFSPGATVDKEGNAIVNEGDNVTVTITPYPGYEMAELIVDGVSEGAQNSYTFPDVTSDHSISGRAVHSLYSITSNAGANGSIVEANGYALTGLPFGTIRTMNIIPDEGYHVADVIVDGASVGAVNSYLFTNITGNHTISATFAINTDTISAIKVPFVIYSFIPDSTLDYGGDVTVDMTIDEPGVYVLSDVIVDGVSKGAQSSYTFHDVTSNHTIMGEAVPAVYNITTSAGSHGSIVEANGHPLTGLPFGTPITMNIIPDAGYHVADVLVDGKSVGPVSSYVFFTDQNHTISATFAINTYTIQRGPDSHSTISISPNYVVEYGGTATANITVNPGYVLTDVIVDGTSIGVQNSYTFSNVTSNHLIESKTEPSCIAPLAPTALSNLETTATSVSSTIVPSGSPSGYMVITSINPISSVPLDGTNYAAGTSFGGGTVKYVGTSPSFTVNGLSSNTLYNLYVYAYNNIVCADGPVYSSAITFSEITAPDAPSNVTATAGDGTATISFSSVDNSQNISKYTVTSNPDNIQKEGLTSPITVTGLTNGTPYEFTITATNIAHETSNPSVVSNIVTPQTPCTAPASAIELDNILATTTSLSGTIISSGPPTGYMVVSGKNTISSVPVDGTVYTAGASFGGGKIQYVGVSPSFNASGLSSNTIYNLYVYAYNNTACSGGPVYSSVATFSEMTAPDAPGNIFAIAGDGSATVLFTPFSSSQNIEKYTVTSNPGNIQTDGLTSPITVTGLTNGTSYEFTVTATNIAHETSNPSAISNSVTPLGQIFKVTTSAGDNGTIDASSNVNEGGDVTINITPNTGYHVTDVLVDGSSVGAVTSYTFSDITSDHSISATFASNTAHTIKATAGANGSISPSGTVSVYSGNNQTYTITPANSYHVAVIKIDGVSVDTTTEYTFTNVTANHTISVTFAINSYTITSTAGDNGSISPVGAAKVNFGGSKTYTIKPAAGYLVSDVLIDGISAGVVTTYIFTNVTTGHTISASFVTNGYTITANAGENGTITPTGLTPVAYGGSVTYQIAPDLGYHIAGVMVDGISKGNIASYTFNNVKFSHTITANFAINTYTITASAGANGTISPNGITSVNYGGSQLYTVIPNTGYAVTKLTVDGISVLTPTSYTFNNVMANHKISATFTCIKPTAPVISGPGIVNKQQNNLVYTISNSQAGNNYTWTVPSGATINSGQGTASINIRWGNASGNVGCTASNNCSNSTKTTYTVTIGAAFSNTVNNESINANAIQIGTILKINPNPVQDKAKVTFTVAQPCKCSIQLRNLTGKVLIVAEVNAVKGVNEINLDVSHFASGTYFVSLIDNKEIKTLMFIKAK